VELWKTDDAGTKAEFERIRGSVQVLFGVAKAVDPVQIKKDLVENTSFGLRLLEKSLADIINIAAGLSQGRDPQIYEERVKTISEAIAKVKQALDFYVRADNVINAGKAFDKILMTAPTTEADAKEIADSLRKTSDFLGRYSRGLNLETLSEPSVRNIAAKKPDESSEKEAEKSSGLKKGAGEALKKIPIETEELDKE